jgi:hypothetical protein
MAQPFLIVGSWFKISLFRQTDGEPVAEMPHLTAIGTARAKKFYALTINQQVVNVAFIWHSQGSTEIWLIEIA